LEKIIRIYKKVLKEFEKKFLKKNLKQKMFLLNNFF